MQINKLFTILTIVGNKQMLRGFCKIFNNPTNNKEIYMAKRKSRKATRKGTVVKKAKRKTVRKTKKTARR